MIIFHGDYKDLNCVNDVLTTLKDGIRPGDIEELMPLWHKLKSGEANLVQKRLTDDEICRMPKIVITNSVFEETQYTSYVLVRGTDDRTALSHYKGFPNKFIDKENGFIVLEKDENRGYEIKGLEDVKEREIAFYKGVMKRFDANEKLSERHKELENKLCMEAIAKWESKTEARWFHETELTKSSSEIEQIAKEFEFVPGTEEPCDSQGYEYFVDCVYKDEIFPVFIAIESSFPMNMQAAQQIYRQLTREEEREER